VGLVVVVVVVAAAAAVGVGVLEDQRIILSPILPLGVLEEV